MNYLVFYFLSHYAAQYCIMHGTVYFEGLLLISYGFKSNRYPQVSVYHLNELDTHDNYFCHVCHVPNFLHNSQQKLLLESKTYLF